MKEGVIYSYLNQLLILPIETATFLYLVKREKEGEWYISSKKPFQILKASPKDEKRFFADFKPASPAAYENEKRALLKAVLDMHLLKVSP
jgi:hypothetical protein